MKYQQQPRNYKTRRQPKNDTEIYIFFVKLIAEALLVFCLTLILLFINLITSCSGLSSTLITAFTTYFLKNAPFTILATQISRSWLHSLPYPFYHLQKRLS